MNFLTRSIFRPSCLMKLNNISEVDLSSLDENSFKTVSVDILFKKIRSSQFHITLPMKIENLVYTALYKIFFKQSSSHLKS